MLRCLRLLIALALAQRWLVTALQLPDELLVLENEGEDPTFGTEVVASEDFVVVKNYGLASFYVFSADGTFLRQLPVQAGGQHVYEVMDLVGDRLLIGNPTEAKAMLFSVSTGQLLHSFASDNEHGYGFGSAVALCGDSGLGLVASMYEQIVFVVDIEHGGIVHQLLSSNPSVEAFGESVDCSNDYIVIGAPDHDFDDGGGGGGGGGTYGAVYIFNLQGELLAMIHKAGEYDFGKRVAVWERYVAVSFDGGVSLRNADAGFEGEIVPLLDDMYSMEFGFTLEMHGGVLAVGDPGAVTPSGSAGAIYTFDLATYQQREVLVFTSENETDDVIGMTAAVYGNRVWAGVARISQSESTPPVPVYTLSPMRLANMTLAGVGPDSGATRFVVGIAMSTLYTAAYESLSDGPDTVAIYSYEYELLHVLHPFSTSSFRPSIPVIEAFGDWVLVTGGDLDGGLYPGEAYLYSAPTGDLLYHLMAPNPADSLFGVAASLCGSSNLAAIAGTDVVYVYNFSTQPPELIHFIQPTTTDLEASHPGGFGRVISCDGWKLAIQAPEIGLITLHDLSGNASTDYQVVAADAQGLLGKYDTMALHGGYLAFSVTNAAAAVLVYDTTTLQQITTVVPKDRSSDLESFGMSVALDQGMLLVSTIDAELPIPVGRAWLYNLSSISSSSIANDGTMLLPSMLYDRLFFGLTVSLGRGHAAVSSVMIFPEVEAGGMHIFLNAYDFSCAEPLPTAPSTPVITDITTNSALVHWGQSKSTCYYMSHYIVYVFVQGQGYVQWQKTAESTAEVENLQPGTTYRIKVAAVDVEGGSKLSMVSQEFSTVNDSYIEFDASGQVLTVYIPDEFHSLVQNGAACVLAERFYGATEFGPGASCQYKTVDLMVVFLTAGATVLPFDWLGYVSVSSPEPLFFEVQPPANPREITGILAYPALVSFCDDIELDASSFSGVGAAVYGLTYSWQVEAVDGLSFSEVAEINALLEMLPPTEPVLVLPNGTFPADSSANLTLVVTSEIFGNTSTIVEARLTVSGPPVPEIYVTPKTNTIAVSDALTVEVAVQYGKCFLETVGSTYQPQFTWSITGGPDSHSDQPDANWRVSSDTRSVTVPSFSLMDTRAAVPYNVRAELAVPGGAVIASSASIHVVAAEPVALIADSRRTVSVEEGAFTIDASLSYDPTVCRAFQSCVKHLRFAYDCSYADGSSCCQFTSQNTPSMELNLASVFDCNPAGPATEAATVFLQVQATSTLTGLSGTATIQLDITRSSDAPADELAMEPILPRRFSGFAGLSKRPRNTPVWRVIRRATSAVIASAQGDTAIFDTQTLPNGEQFTLEATAGSSRVETTFYTPSKPLVGSFVLRSGSRVYEPGQSVPGLTSAINLVAMDFVDVEHSTTPLHYSFTDSLLVFSAATQQPLPMTLLLNQPSSSNQLGQVLLTPGQHTLQVRIHNEAGGIVKVEREVQASQTYETAEQLLAFISSYDRTRMSAQSNSVGALAAALSWIGEGIQSPCNHFGGSLAGAQETLLSVWLQQADRAAQQATSSVKGLQDLFVLTLPGLCITDNVLAWAIFDQSLKLFMSVPHDQLPTDSCALSVQILSSVLSVPGMAITDTDQLRGVLHYLDTVLQSYCGVSVFSYNLNETSSSEATRMFLDAASILRDLSVSSVRAARGTALDIELDGLTVHLSPEAATELAEALRDDADDASEASGFWDVSSYRIARHLVPLNSTYLSPSSSSEQGDKLYNNDADATKASDIEDGSLLSDVFELNIRLASLPSFRFCNSIIGEIEDADRCVTHREGLTSVKGLSELIVFTVAANLTSSSGRHRYSCQYFDPDANQFSEEGCEVLATSIDMAAGYANVTCGCNHLTAFAVRQVAFTTLSDCEDLGSWLALLVLLGHWLVKTAKAIKTVNASVVANALFFPVCFLRLAYFGMLQYVSYTGPNVACVEFGIDGADSVFGQHTVPIVHDLAIPIMLVAFTSVALYWYELEKSLAGPLSKMLSSRYLSRQTLIIFLVIDVLLLCGFVGANFALLGANRVIETDLKTTARGMLIAFSAVCALECIFFLYYGLSVIEAGGGRKKMKKVSKLMYSSCTMFLVMAALLYSFSMPGFITDAQRTFRLYSVLLHVVEFAGTACMVCSLAAARPRQKSKRDQTFLDKLFSRISNVLADNTTSTANLSQTPKNSAVSAISRFGITSEPERDVELVNHEFHLDQTQVGAESFKRRAALELARDSSTFQLSDGSEIDWSNLDDSSRSGFRLSDLAASSTEIV